MKPIKTAFPQKKYSPNSIAAKGNDPAKPQGSRWVSGYGLSPNDENLESNSLSSKAKEENIQNQSELAFFPNPQSIIGPENCYEENSDPDEASSQNGSNDSFRRTDFQV